MSVKKIWDEKGLSRVKIHERIPLGIDNGIDHADEYKIQYSTINKEFRPSIDWTAVIFHFVVEQCLVAVMTINSCNVYDSILSKKKYFIVFDLIDVLFKLIYN